MTDMPDQIIEYKDINFCQSCNKNIENAPYRLLDKKQEIELPPIAPVYIEHQCFKKTCHHCGAINKSSLPSNLKANIQYGATIEAQVAYFHAFQFVSINRIQAYFKDIVNLTLSQGTISNMLTKFVIRSKLIYKTIQAEVSNSKVVGADETGSKIAGKKGWFHVWQTPSLTFIAASMTRGYNNVINYFPNGLVLLEF